MHTGTPVHVHMSKPVSPQASIVRVSQLQVSYGGMISNSKYNTVCLMFSKALDDVTFQH